MFKNFVDKGKKILQGPQSSMLSAAVVIMIMIIASRVLGLVRQRTLAHFYSPEEISIFFAAFRLPDTIFELLVFGTFSSAFIPVFTKLSTKDKKASWLLASRISNLGLLFFIPLAYLISQNSHTIYSLIAGGYTPADIEKIASLARVLFAAQGFFVISYVLTGVLEANRRFLIPALAPIVYNIGIILATIFLHDSLGLRAPTYGVFIGALLHFLVQLPLAIKLGYKVIFSFKIDKNVKKIGRLSAPRILEIGFNQIAKSVELYLSSFVSTASYAYYYLANSIQLIPVGIVGTSIAKAALPTLSKHANDKQKFNKSLWGAFNQVIFLVSPMAAALVVLRIPVVRLLYGTEIFDWQSTVQTGYVVSAFAIGIVTQSAVAILSRGYYAMHNTKTPVKISIFTISLTVFLNFIFLKVFKLPVWGLALSFSIGSATQLIILFTSIRKLTNKNSMREILTPAAKSTLSTLLSSVVMYSILKLFDRSVWVKRLSFLGKFDATVSKIPFEKFVLDTRYTINLLILTIIVITVGVIVYLCSAYFLGSQELLVFLKTFKRILTRKKIAPIPQEEEEQVSPPQSDSVY